jgi:hypothetical protein
MKELFEFIRNQLLDFIGHDPDGEDYSIVNFVDHMVDPPGFNARVNLMLINIEEEKLMRPADRYIQVDEEGKAQKSKPPLMLILYMLIALKPSSKSTDSSYGDTLQNLSKVIQFFQSNPFLTKANFPGMPAGLNHLFIEFNPLTYAQQNEIWSALKRSYLPSLCYKIKMLTYTGDAYPQESEVGEFGSNLRGS